MSSDIIIEVEIALKALAIGAVCCFVYDMLRIFRRLIPRGSIMTGIEDIICFMIAALAIFVFMYNTNGGIVRAYIIVFAILGVMIWEIAFGRVMVKYISKALKKIFKLLSKVLKKILKPFTIIKRYIIIKKRGAKVEEKKGKSKEKK